MKKILAVIMSALLILNAFAHAAEAARVTTRRRA